MAVNREYKSDVFSMLLEDKANALEIYNALNDSHYDRPEDVEIILLEKGISLSVRNDATFIIDMYMNFYEHQSTYNANMPLRDLIYYANTMEKRLKQEKRDLFSRQLIKIPTPRFAVFYNGTEKRPAKEILRLSDAFVHSMEVPELELICTVYNINPGCNGELLEKSEVLRGYTTFVELVRRLEREYNSLETAIDRAMDECIRQHIFEDFFRERKDEVRKMTELDFTWERREELIRMEERAEGRVEGRAEGRAEGQMCSLITQVVKKMKKNYPVEQIADELEEEEAVIRKICDTAEQFAPEYDVEQIYKALDYSAEEYRQAMKIVEKK